MTYTPGASFSTNTAASAPTSADDNTQGFAVGSRWFDTTNDEEWVCMDASTGAAVWENTTTGESVQGSISNDQVAHGTSGGAIEGTDRFRYDGTRLDLDKDGGTSSIVRVTEYTSNAPGATPRVRLRRARGTKASPANIADADVLGEVAFSGRTAGSFTEFAKIIAKAINAAGVSGRITFQVRVGGTAEDRMDLCDEGVCIKKSGSTGPVLYVAGDNNADYGATVRITGEPAMGTWRGAYWQYDAGDNEAVMGIHDPDDKLTASDTPCIRFHRHPLGLITYNVRNAPPVSVDLDNGELAFYVNETSNTLHFAVKESGGTFSTGVVGTY